MYLNEFNLLLTFVSVAKRRRIFMNKKWIKAAGVRAIKTMAQTAVAMIPAAATITQVDWITVAGTVALAGALSILTSVAGLPEVEE